jgi:hypothetical protein
MTDAEVKQMVDLMNRYRVAVRGTGPHVQNYQPRQMGLYRIRSDLVIPDGTNRERTGLSLEHMHYLGTRFSAGFCPREGTRGHDIPVVVRENPPSAQGREALERWRATTKLPGYPPCTLEPGAREFYCSLGNGHFSQALNLHRHGVASIFPGGEVFGHTDDENLRTALEYGVPSLVLRGDMPWKERKFISLVLNKSQVQRWDVSEDGEVFVMPDSGEGLQTQFEALSKDLDAEELSALVRTKLGLDVPVSRSKL